MSIRNHPKEKEDKVTAITLVAWICITLLLVFLTYLYTEYQISKIKFGIHSVETDLTIEFIKDFCPLNH